DIIPDALSVIYFYATDNDLEFGLSAISVVTPANINALKRGLSGASDAVAAINKGEELMKEGVQLSAIKQEVNQVASVFKISPSEFDAAFTEKIINKVTETKSLLTTNPTKAKIYSHVSEKLEPAKRKEFVNKFLDDADFRNKVLADPDEVLRWGGNFLENIVHEHEMLELVKLTKYLPGPKLPDKIAYTFENSI